MGAQEANAASAGEPGGAAGGDGAGGADALLQERKEIEKLREELRWAISDKDRAVTVCSAAVEGEKLRGAEVWPPRARIHFFLLSLARVLIRAHGHAHARKLHPIPVHFANK